MEAPKSQKEHEWLQRLAGEWTYEADMLMGPDQPPHTSSGTCSVRSLGGMWTVEEWNAAAPDGTPAISLMTLGYDPKKGKFVGSFVSSMMSYLWLYEGSLDGDVLTLDAEGPSMIAEGMQPYQDILEFLGDDERVLSSRMRGPDGEWTRFMTMRFRRKR
jgi:Protein of unknown function (DUF1579)